YCLLPTAYYSPPTAYCFSLALKQIGFLAAGEGERVLRVLCACECEGECHARACDLAFEARGLALLHVVGADGAAVLAHERAGHVEAPIMQDERRIERPVRAVELDARARVRDFEPHVLAAPQPCGHARFGGV